MNARERLHREMGWKGDLCMHGDCTKVGTWHEDLCLCQRHETMLMTWDRFARQRRELWQAMLGGLPRPLTEGVRAIERLLRRGHAVK